MAFEKRNFKPCYYCNRYGGEWDDSGKYLRPITAPRNVKVEEGDKWTCRLCVEEGRPQEAPAKKSNKEDEDYKLL